MSQRSQMILGPMRVPFLLLAIACVLLGAGTAFWTTGQFNLWYIILILVGALCAHISVNALNEYDDFKSGLDLKTRRTPFSGGSGMLPANPGKAAYALVTGLTSLAVTLAVGIYFISVWGWGILPIGLLGVLVITLYTRWLTRSPLLCLIAPGLGFGPLMVMGVHFVLTGQYSWTAFAASLVPFFLVSDLLLLNQFPDHEADSKAGRRHLIIAWGPRAGILAYGIFLACAYLSVIAAVLMHVLPSWGLIALGTLLIALPVFIGANRYHSAIPELIPFMGRNVVLTLVTPVLLAVGIFIA